MGELALLKPRLGKFRDLHGDGPRITSSSTPTLKKWCFGVWSLNLHKIYIKYHPHFIRVWGISCASVKYTSVPPPKQNTGSCHLLRIGPLGPFQSILLPQEVIPNWLQSALITLPQGHPLWAAEWVTRGAGSWKLVWMTLLNRLVRPQPHREQNRVTTTLPNGIL